EQDQKLDQRFAEQEEKIDQKFTEQDQKLDKRFTEQHNNNTQWRSSLKSEIDAAFDKNKKEFDAKLEAMEARIDHNMSKRLEPLQKEILSFHSEMHNMNLRMERVENKVDELNEVTRNLNTKIDVNTERIMNNFVKIMETRTILGEHERKLELA
uniref:hypothetical protein n=1 Tax=Robinsoniella peoriensis TaxID=180332 RepID=UPI0037506614